MLHFFLALALPTLLLADDSVPNFAAVTPDIPKLVAELGDDSYLVRERAEAQLLRIGAEAFAELQQATKSDDVEIAQRARQIISQIEQNDRGSYSSSVRGMIGLYMQESNVAQKTRYLWAIAGFPDCEGLRAICRIARFDPEHTLRIEAVKCLIASPPTTYSMRKKWYQSLKAVFAGDEKDELLGLVYNYAVLRCETVALKESAEAAAKEIEKTSGIPVEYPVATTAPDDMKKRILAFTDQLAVFQAKPESSVVQPGHRFDILLFIAIAELQDVAGLSAERDRTLDAALAVRTEKMRSDNPLLLIDPLEEEMFIDHYRVAEFLEASYRYHWAERHFQLVSDEAPIPVKIEANSKIYDMKRLLAQYDEAQPFLDKNIALLRSDDYKFKPGNSDKVIKHCLAAKDYCYAMVAAGNNDWATAKKRVDSCLKENAEDADALILRYEISKMPAFADDQYRKDSKQFIDGLLAQIENMLQARGPNFDLPQACNHAAWLLANTDGDYKTALQLIKTTLKAEPESALYLDTMGHVYALGKDYAKAVETQEAAVRLAPEATSLQNALKRFRESAKNEKK